MPHHSLDRMHLALTDQAGSNASITDVVPGQAIALRGPISTRTSATVRTALCAAIHQGEGDLVVRMDEAELWDGTGLGVLVGAHERARRQGRRLVVANPSERTHRVLVRSRLARVMPICHVTDESAA